MGKFIDLTGQVFGKWTVIQKGENKNNQIYWLCQCDCGTIRQVNGNSLRNGTSTNCGCLRKPKQDLTNQRFGKLVVKNWLGAGKWLCECDCGNNTEVTSYNLTSGHVEQCKQCGYKMTAQKRTEDLTGKTFGKLTVLSQVVSKNSNGPRWLCRCECGTLKEIDGSSLKQGLTQSCGCVNSRGESLIIKILQDNNIDYQYQKTFEDCIFPQTKKKAKFDFFINSKYIIEYDGEQHFHYTNNGWCNKENFEALRQRDLFKNQWCKDNHIPLIRIPYTHFNDLKLEDLILETSTFLVV